MNMFINLFNTLSIYSVYKYNESKMLLENTEGYCKIRLKVVLRHGIYVFTP